MLRGKGCQSNGGRFYPVDVRRVLLSENLIGDGSREHMAGDVPGRSWRGQYGNREKYKGCD